MPIATRNGPATAPARLLTSLALVAVLTAASATGCGAASTDDEATGPTAIRVFAASSLTEVMADLATAFEAGDPTTEVELNLAGSATLRAQILEGAPADVVATANPAVLDDLVAADAVTDQPTLFATNRLVLAVAPGNPGQVAGLADLADDDLFVGLCAAGVPCGDLADQVLASAGIVVRPDTREPDVRSLLTKVAAGELDAGLVYVTDVDTELARSRGVERIDLPADLDAVTGYPAAMVAESAEPVRAQRFVAFLTGQEARSILADHGFGAP